MLLMLPMFLIFGINMFVTVSAPAPLQGSWHSLTPMPVSYIYVHVFMYESYFDHDPRVEHYNYDFYPNVQRA